MKLTAQKFHNFNKRKGFTLIELLIVVSILGILAGLTINVINPTRQRNVAEDGVRRANMEKVSQALESFNAAEGRYPTTAERDAYATVGSVAGTYIKTWPVGRNGDAYTYAPFTAGAPTKFQVSVLKASNTSAYIIYNSDWGKIMECTALPVLAAGATATTNCTDI
jgi:prepilin-type N-terminal cleavage/methylation domain-containing protein